MHRCFYTLILSRNDIANENNSVLFYRYDVSTTMILIYISNYDSCKSETSKIG